MVSLQPKINLKVSQRQVLTPGLMQMVSVLALNKLELKDMIQAEIAENPVLEELEEQVPLLEHTAQNGAEPLAAETKAATDPFEEIDFGAYFQEYLDPGFRSPDNFEVTERPSLENFLSERGSLADHLCWQLGSLSLRPELRAAAESIIGNLDEAGYLQATEEELREGLAAKQHDAVLDREQGSAALIAEALQLVQRLDPSGIAARDLRECLLLQLVQQRAELLAAMERKKAYERTHATELPSAVEGGALPAPAKAEAPDADVPAFEDAAPRPGWTKTDGGAPGHLGTETDARLLLLDLAITIVSSHLVLLAKRDLRELARAAGCTPDEAGAAVELIRSLDPHPGHRFEAPDARLIEPDVAFVKRDDDWIAVLDDESVPSLRLNRSYRRLLRPGNAAEKDVRDYVKERYRSALQLMRNIEQRKNTILRTCEVIVRRQYDFLEQGVEALRPMMIKEVAEEIGVHPSTVSRAVSNKYVHTPQGVFELRFFFSEGVQGPEGAGTPLVLLKRKVKKIIEDEDPRRPLTDDAITQLLQAQGIDVTRRTVAKYREDLHIPSTHQRRIRE